MSNLNRNEIIINGIVLNTSIEAHRRVLGAYSENILLKFLINNGVNIKYMNDNNKFNQYDFFVKAKDGIKYILELKSRIGNISNHSFEIIDDKKISYYKHLKNIIPIFIFLHYNNNDQDDYNIYYYNVESFDKLDNDCFYNHKYNTYELPIKMLKDINELVKIL